MVLRLGKAVLHSAMYKVFYFCGYYVHYIFNMNSLSVHIPYFHTTFQRHWNFSDVELFYNVSMCSNNILLNLYCTQTKNYINIISVVKSFLKS